MIPLVKTRPVMKGGVVVENSRGEDGEEMMTDASDALAIDGRLLMLTRHEIVTASSRKLIMLLPLRSEYLCFIVGYFLLLLLSWSWQEIRTTTCHDDAAIFSWRFLRRFWGRKRREKRRRKVRVSRFGWYCSCTNR